MFERLTGDARQKARALALDADLAVTLAESMEYAEQLRQIIRRESPELGERFLLPSGQTTGRFEEAICAWSD